MSCSVTVAFSTRTFLVHATLVASLVLGLVFGQLFFLRSFRYSQLLLVLITIFYIGVIATKFGLSIWIQEYGILMVVSFVNG